MKKGRVITSGKIWANRTCREVLYSILKIKTVNGGILRINDSANAIEGDVGILKGIYVVGGLVQGGANGYLAVKSLLSTKEGTFQYIDVGEDVTPSCDQNLKVRITQIINMLPDLPEDVEELQAKSTLSRIRAMDASQLTDPAEIGVIDQTAATELANWETSWNQRTRVRAIALWTTFAVVACLAAVLYWAQPK